MAQYAFPAVFTKEDCGYSIHFPDLDNCFTSAQTIPEGLEMACDALCLMLSDMEDNGEPIPAPSEPGELRTGSDSFVSLISCNTVPHRNPSKSFGI